MKNFTQKSLVFLLFVFFTISQVNAQDNCATLNSVYQTVGGGGELKIFKYKLSTQKFEEIQTFASNNSVGLGTKSGAASAFNSSTELLYINSADNNQNIRVFDPANNFDYVGKINLLNYNSGSLYANLFSNGDNIYFRTSNNMYKFNVKSLNFATGITSSNVTSSPIINNTGKNYNCNDYAYYKGVFYGISGVSSSSGSARRDCDLVMIDENTNTLTVRRLNITDSNPSHILGNVNNNDFGAVWVESEGTMLFFNNETGNVYLLKDVDKSTSLNFNWVLPSASSSSNDGFSCESTNLFQPILVYSKATCFSAGTATIDNYLNNTNTEYLFYDSFGNFVNNVTISSTGLITGGLNYDQDYTVSLYLKNANYTSVPSEKFQIPSIFAKPIANAGPNVTINCTSPSTTLSATGAGVGGSYSWSPSAGLSATNISNPIATPTSTTTYTVTVTNANGCIDTSNVTVTVDKTIPVLSASVTVQPSCATAKGTIVVSAPNPAVNVVYTLTGTNPVVAAVTQAPRTFANLAPGDYSLTTTNTATGCQSAPLNLKVNVGPEIPIAVLLTGSTICTSPGNNGTITSSTSVSGVNYQLFNSSGTLQTAQAGTGSGLTWSNLPAGNGYYIIATNSTNCTATSAAVNVLSTANPIAILLTGSMICASPGNDGTITSSTSVNGVNYQLFNSSGILQAAQAGTGSGLTWSNLPAGNGYYVIATNAANCTTTSNTVNVLTTANPIALLLTGSTICALPGNNGTITSSTSVSGVNYQLFNSSNVTVQASKAGNGSGLSWINLPAGNGYYVIATNTSNCVTKSTSVNVITTANPIALLLTGSTICNSPGNNGTITSSTSVSGVNYQLFNSSNATVQASKAGNGSGLSWINLPVGNGYYVIATNTSNCEAKSTIVNVVDTVNPIALLLTGSTICASPGNDGTITSTTSINGVNYQLYNSSGSLQAAQAGTGSGLTWSNLPAGNGYYIIATNATNCTTTSSTVNVLTTANPIALLLTGSTICATPGNNGTITSSTSVNGVNYQLFNSSSTLQAAQAGTGSGLTWSNLPAGNDYYVIATNTSSCNTSSNKVNVAIDPDPAMPIIDRVPPTCLSDGKSILGNYLVTNVYTFDPLGPSVSGTGEIINMALDVFYTLSANNGTCTSGISAPFKNVGQLTSAEAPLINTTPPTCLMDGTSTITNYNPSSTYTFTPTEVIPQTISPTGLIMGMVLGVTYTVSSDDTSCISPSSSQFSNLEKLPSPIALVLTGSTICALPGNNGTITSSTSVSGVNYQLFNSSGSLQAAQAGTGSGLTWSNLPIGNGYYVIATNSTNCTATSAAVNVLSTANPIAILLTGSMICASPGNDGTITSNTSVSGVNYQLYNSSGSLQAAQAGTGAGLTWSNLLAGNGYYVVATNATNCTATSNTVNVLTTANPIALSLTGSTICASPGNDGTITSDTSVTNTTYQLYASTNVAIQTEQAGTGSGLTWSNLAAGNGYYVVATNAASCTTISATVNVLTTANPMTIVLTGSTICSSPGNNGTITSGTSVNGVNYQLFNSSSTLQAAQGGTGSRLTWSNLPAGNGYYVIATNATNCTTSSNIVNVLATANPIALQLTGSTICISPDNNGTITSGTSVNGVNYQLFNSSDLPIQASQAGDGLVLIWANLPAGIGYYVIATNTSNCVATSNIVNVLTTANPIALSLTGSVICASPGNNGTITSGTSVTNMAYQLYNSNNIAIQAEQAGTGSGLTWFNLPEGNGYYVIGTNAASCTTSSAIVNVLTTANPIALLVTGSTICSSSGNNGTITSDTSVSGIDYQLFNSSGLPVQTVQAGTDSGLIWSNLPARNGYYVMATNSASCTSTSITVNVITAATPIVPEARVTVQPSCTNPTGTIVVSAPVPAANVSYTLTGINPVVAAVTQGASIFTNLNPGEYSIITTDTDTGCISLPTSLSFSNASCPSIDLIKTAKFNDENGDSFANLNETITYSFKVTNTGNTVLTNITISDPLPGIEIKTGIGSLSLGIGESNSTFFTATYIVKQGDINQRSVTNEATVFGESSTGKVEGKSKVTLDLYPGPECVITVYNVITPNNDGINDFFEIEGLECYSDNTVEIYNRWGILVFERNQYNNFDRSFKGISEGRVTINASELLPSGTYFYIIKYKDYDSVGHDKSGYLNINR